MHGRKTKRPKGRVIALGAATALALLSGCSAGTEAVNDGPTEVTIWTVSLGETADEWEAIIAQYEKEHDGVTITLEERETDAHAEALRRSAGTGAGPDIYFNWTGIGAGGELVNEGISADLTEYAQKYGWLDRFTPAALTAAEQFGGFHGVPWQSQALAVYYDKVVFEELGIEEPTTYDELKEAAATIKDAGLIPMGLSGSVNWQLMRLIDSQLETFCGPEPFDSLVRLEADWSEEECVTEAFTEFRSWYDYLPDGFMGLAPADVSTGFLIEGKTAMTISIAAAAADLHTAKGVPEERIGIMRFPTGTDRLYSYGEAHYISEASEVKDEAAEFLDFLTSDAILTEYGGAWNPFSVNKNVPLSDEPATNGIWKGLIESSDGVYSTADQNFPLDVVTEFFRLQNAVMVDEVAPEDVGSAFQEFIDNRD